MERENLEMDVVFVGAGPANLSGAFHLASFNQETQRGGRKGERRGESLGEIEIGVNRGKGASVGAHILSGAVMDPRALRELMPDFVEQGAPLESKVNEDYFIYLTKSVPSVHPHPTAVKNHGYYIVSLNRLTAWLG